MTIAQAAEALGSVLVPPRCSGCDAPGLWLCAGCRDALEPRATAVDALRIAAAGAYEGPVRRAVHRFKYRGERSLATELGELVAGLIARDLARGKRLDAVVPVPLHRERLLARGYDQTALLADAVAAFAGLPVRRAVRRIRHARPQMELDRDDRARNVEGTFVGCAESLRGLRVAVVDDVATTGSTCAAVARAARASGARAVRAYVVALDE